ncbi:MAG: hypothetical protein RL755_76 [Pseudomonadota bacterium]|jgi:hypothetical protein
MSVTVDGYLAFIRGCVQIAPELLPDDSAYISTSYALSLETVNPIFAAVSPLHYEQAVYNLATDYLINITPDQSGQTFFADTRQKFDCVGFVSGVISSASDSGTSSSLVTPEAFTGLTIGDLQNLKTPWGRAYLAVAQQYGSIFAVS